MKKKIKILFVILLATLGIIALFVIIVGGASYIQNHISKSIGNVVLLLFPISVFAYALIFNKKYNHLSARTTGFYPQKFIKNIVFGIILAVVLNAIVFSLASILFGIQLEFIALKPHFGKLLLKLLATCIVIGFWEEFYFRGLVLNTLIKNNFGFHCSALISALLFSIVHWCSFDMAETSYFWYVGIVFMGYILAILYTYFSSIWAVVSFHFFWDVLAFCTDPKENKIGFMRIKDYALNSKNLDNAAVLVLGIFLALLLYIIKKRPKNIQLYVSKINGTAELRQ